MRDGVRLFVTAWHPEGDGPFPAVINYDPYRSSDSRTLARGNVFEYLARHGYVVMHLSVRGTDGSEGTVDDEYLLREQLDGYDAVEWAAAQAWCNGSVGMVGTSYAGFTCLQVAMHRPPHLKAIVPLYATDDRYTDDVHFPGAALFTLCDLPGYATSMVCMNALPPHESLGPDLAPVWQAHLNGNEPYQLTRLAHQTDDDYWRTASLRPGYDRIQRAVFIIGGWMDGYKNGTVRVLQHLQAPKKALIGPWAHIFPDWGVPGPQIDFMSQMVRWFAHLLKGHDTGVLDEPALTAYMQQYDPPHRTRQFTSGSWRTEPGWPVPGAVEQTLFLGPSGALQTAAPAEESSDSFDYRATLGTANRTWSGDPWLGCPEDQRPDEVYSLVYTSESVTERLEILGWPRVKLAFTSTAPVVNVVFNLCDVAPDSTSALVTFGVLNAAHRASHTDSEPLVPGQETEIEVTLDVAGRVFDPGHRIRLDISGSDWPNSWPSPYPTRNTIGWGGTSASRLSLPAVPAGRPEDSPVFGPPVMPLDRYVLSGPPTEIEFARDPNGDRARFKMAANDFGRLADEGIEFEQERQTTSSVGDRNPGRASLANAQTIRVTRHGTPTAARVHALLESTEDMFHLSHGLRVTVGEVERCRRRRMRSYPRRLL
jgi:putative CocE/NonD family hydrolase